MISKLVSCFPFKMSTVAGTNDSRVKVKLVKVKFFEGDVEEVPKINLEEEFRERLFDDGM